MMSKKFRLIPSVLYREGSVVKSVNFDNFRVVGDLPSTMRVFSRRQADELIICDLDASLSRKINWDMVATCVENSNMPLTYAGGVENSDTALKLIATGFDKICVNSIIYEDPNSVYEIAKSIGSSSTMASIDIVRDKSNVFIYSNCGSKFIRELDIYSEIKFLENIGVGEVTINCIDRDGVMNGYDFFGIEFDEFLVKLPILISGGCSGSSCVKAAFERGFDGAVMSSIFLWKGDSIPSLKRELRDEIPVREVI